MATAEVHQYKKPIGPKLESGRMERPKSAQPGSPSAEPKLGKGPKVPVPERPKTATVGDTPGKGGVPRKGGPGPAASFAMRMGNGVAHAGKGATTNSGGLTAIMAAVFGIVALAKVRGQANISTSHALFGGFILLFILTLLYKLNDRLATMFALLVLIAALLEYGEAAFGGLFTGGSGVPAPLPLGTDIAAPVTSTGYLGTTQTTNPDGSNTWLNTYNGGTISITKPPLHG